VGLGVRTERRLEALPGLPAEARQAITQLMRDTAGAALPGLRERPDSGEIVEEIEAAFSASTRTATLVAAGWIGVGLVAATRLPQDRHSREGAGAGRDRAGGP
jgi:hypothetical protein